MVKKKVKTKSVPVLKPYFFSIMLEKKRTHFPTFARTRSVLVYFLEELASVRAMTFEKAQKDIGCHFASLTPCLATKHVERQTAFRQEDVTRRPWT